MSPGDVPPKLPPAKFLAHTMRPGMPSPNPHGRNGSEVAREARALAAEYVPDAIRRLGELMLSRNERVACIAANSLLDRVLGKPAQSVDITHSSSSASRMDLTRLTDDEVREMQRLALKAAIPGDAPIASIEASPQSAQVVATSDDASSVSPPSDEPTE